MEPQSFYPIRLNDMKFTDLKSRKVLVHLPNLNTSNPKNEEHHTYGPK